jgi:hypothetical protein
MLMAIPAFAGGSSDVYGEGQANILNGQVNLDTVWSQLDTTIDGVNEDVTATATAVGNTATIITFADSDVTNQQNASGMVGSDVNADISNVGGNAWLTASTVCNAVDISTDPQMTKVHSSQICSSPDPVAGVNAQVNNVAGTVGIDAQAVGNQFAIDTNATKFPLSNFQKTTGGVNANVNATVHNVGAAAVSATAVGNTAQIIHY